MEFYKIKMNKTKKPNAKNKLIYFSSVLGVGKKFIFSSVLENDLFNFLSILNKKKLLSFNNVYTYLNRSYCLERYKKRK